jgi:flagella basal body P-ring formation protein FlgA
MRYLFALLMVLISCSPCLAAGGVAFRPKAEVAGPEMRLGELADLSGGCTNLADVPLGRSPEPGRALEIDRRELMAKLAVSVPTGSVQVSCPQAVEVRRASQLVGRQQMLAALKEQLERRLTEGGGEVLVSGFRVSEEPLVPAGNLQLEFELPESADRLLGSANFALLVKVEGQVARKLRTGAEVKLSRPVVVAAAQIARHQVLGPDDLRLEPREVTNYEPAVSLEEAVGKRAGRRIEAGAVVAQRDLEEPPVLAKGSNVTILVEAGPLNVSTRGTARQSGRVGETIRVVNIDSKRELSAVVLDGGTVRVPFER